mmetsp:Transcript_28682/g.71795  ORF Transcript_28682/g.71795 Transcript_28682/m.71795 type:complete len:180 (-) Transcript_28682:99-638(-)
MELAGLSVLQSSSEVSGQPLHLSESRPRQTLVTNLLAIASSEGSVDLALECEKLRRKAATIFKQGKSKYHVAMNDVSYQLSEEDEDFLQLNKNEKIRLANLSVERLTPFRFTKSSRSKGALENAALLAHAAGESVDGASGTRKPKRKASNTFSTLNNEKTEIAIKLKSATDNLDIQVRP